MEAVSRRALDRIRDRLLKRGYPSHEIMTEHRFQIDAVSNAGQHQSAFQAYKLTSSTGQDVVILGTTNATFSRLAPYNGWEAFKKQAQGLWEIHRKVVGRAAISRVGMRYINRIDVPISADPVQLQDYILVYPEYPQHVFPIPSQVFCQLSMPSADGDFATVINCGSIPSPVPKRFGILLDLDVARIRNFPHVDAEFWSMLDGMRDRKNELFEASITDRTRQLFA